MSELTIRPGPPVRGKEVFALNYRWSALEPSPNGGEDGDVRELLQDGESILQMLQGIQKEISAATLFDDHVRRFEKLNRLFRCGVSPGIRGGLSRGQGEGCNACFDAPEAPDWYGRPEPCSDFDYYHGATLNLHFGFADTFCTNVEKRVAECATFPSALVGMLQSSPRGPDLLIILWATTFSLILPFPQKPLDDISLSVRVILTECGESSWNSP